MAFSRRFLTGAILAGLLPASLSQASPVALRDPAQRGRVGHYFIGASMVDNMGLANGVECLRSSNSATLDPAILPAGASVVEAKLFIAGSLIGDDGVDFISTNTSLFTTGTLQADDPSDLPLVEQAAASDADRSVMFRPPGATGPVTVTGTTPYVAAYYKPSGPEQGNVAFFVTQIDVTDAINNEGAGQVGGTYTVSGLRADICLGQEASCDASEACSTVSSIHTNGLASWGLLLIVEDRTLPLRAVGTFEGLEILNGSLINLTLTDGVTISDPPAGKLSMYVLEGDLRLPTTDTAANACNAPEYIEVDGDANPTVNGLCLEDDDNPHGNLFNSTINSQPQQLPLPDCTGFSSFQCCVGDGLCGETGVDIDTFDITSALTPNANSVRVTAQTGTDRIALATVVVEADIFEPVLREGSRIVILSDIHNGSFVQLGSQLEYVVAVSNTGNLPATGVVVDMDAPPFVTDFQVLKLPPDATNNSNPTGGASGTGRLNATGFTIAPGEIADLRVSMTVSCEALDKTLSVTATIASDQESAFALDSQPVIGAGPGTGPCEGFDPEGSFEIKPIAEFRRLRGGGGCQAVGGTLSVLACVLLLWRRRTKR